MASIPDENTNLKIVETVTGGVQDDRWYWIGLNSLSGAEKWSDGSPLDYTNWADGQPKHGDYNEVITEKMSMSCHR